MVSKVGRVVSTILMVSTHVSKPVIDSAYRPVSTMAGGTQRLILALFVDRRNSHSGCAESIVTFCR